MKAAILATLTAAALTASAGQYASANQNTPTVEAGVLRCDVDAGVGLVLGSSRDMVCNFITNDGRQEDYRGRITKLGVDVGITGKQRLVWRVLAPKNVDATSSMGGQYLGASAGASAIVGGAANALVGGSGKNFVLQPISLQGGTGLNVAVGVAGMHLNRVN